MSNNSSTGGYLVPSSSEGFPNSETLTQFIQTVLVGISGLNQTLVRPTWQVDPANQPDGDIDWLAFGVKIIGPDANAYIGQNSDNSGQMLLRHEKLEIECHFYGPNCIDFSTLVRDGFQVTQNLEVLQLSDMGFAYTEDARRVPDLINEQWVDRVIMSIFLRRQQNRQYAVLPLLSAQGTIEAEGSTLLTESFDSDNGG